MIAHELGHILGMAHDFNDTIANHNGSYVYRQYDNGDCKGLMDHTDSGGGWSKCSARDFSRTITSGGSKLCLVGKTII